MRASLLHTCTGHRAALYALAPGTQAGHVLSAGGDGWVVDWNLEAPETGQVIATVDGHLYSLQTLPNYLVAGDMNGGLHWIALENPERTRNIQHHRLGVYDLLPFGPWLFSAGGDGLLTRWDTADARSVESLQLSGKALRSIAFSPQQHALAIGTSDGAIHLLDAETLALRRTISGAHSPSVFTTAWSPDGQYLLSGGRDAMLRVWEVEKDFALASEQPAHWYTLNHLVFSPDGRYFATASRDKTIKIWDAASFQLLQVLDVIRDGGHARSVNRLLWLEGRLLSCGDDGTVKVWGIGIEDQLFTSSIFHR